MSVAPWTPCFRCARHVKNMRKAGQDYIDALELIIKNQEKKIKQLELDLEFSKLYLDNKDLIFEAMESYTNDDKEKYNKVHDLYHKLGGLY